MTTEIGTAGADDAGRVRVLVADDHDAFRSGLRSLLATAADVDVVEEAAPAADADRLAERTHPDVGRGTGRSRTGRTTAAVGRTSTAGIIGRSALTA